MSTAYHPEEERLDEEEQWFESNDEGFVPAGEELRDKLVLAAKQTLVELQNKTERMNIRMTKRDLLALKAAAQSEGIPYQSLVTSILHKFTTGQLVDINEAKKILRVS
jgi:predicted DNA binding CopG/RHH family protein